MASITSSTRAGGSTLSRRRLVPGSHTPVTARSSQAMPQRPTAVSNSVKPGPIRVTVRDARSAEGVTWETRQVTRTS